jgi:hypothetical protein
MAMGNILWHTLTRLAKGFQRAPEILEVKKKIIPLNPSRGIKRLTPPWLRIFASGSGQLRLDYNVAQEEYERKKSNLR